MFSQSSLSEPPSSARAFRTLLALGLLLGPLTPPIDAEPLTPIPAIERVLPPPGNPLSDADRTDLKTRAAELCDKIEGVKKANPSNEQLRRLPDVAIYAKAVAWAIDLDEFYAPRELETARELIQQATGRLDKLTAGVTPWTRQTGLVARGFMSTLDGSIQPYGLVIAEGHDFDRPCPLIVWLHGRGDRTTELAFIAQRQKDRGQFVLDNAIVVHPFGRYCNGYKSAGEVDILEVIAAVQTDYKVDPDRIVLAGFSMGGAGAWHMGAHYAERWAAVHAGAGFAETARYQRLKSENFPPRYEQTLWQVYDVPNYVGTLLNIPVLAYSGENDPQIQAARVMDEAYRRAGRKLNHLIGPEMGHKYDSDSLKTIHAFLAECVRQGRDRHPAEISLQTRTLRYPKYHWIEAMGLGAHWHDARIDGRSSRSSRTIELTTRNVNALRITSPWQEASSFQSPLTVTIDSQTLDLPANTHRTELLLERRDDRWLERATVPRPEPLRKEPGLQGPIDDVWLEPFLVVTPSRPSAHPQVERWVEFELSHFKDRWRRLFRGQVRDKRDTEVTPEDLQNYHVIVWGDPSSNQLLARMQRDLPIEWTELAVSVADQAYPAVNHLPVMIYPNPLNPRRYVVINSGMTFREGHDRSNSLQNPKLPDWAVINLDQLPDAFSPGKVLAAGFFDEHWRLPMEANASTESGQ